jgi:hypothetical protein
MVEGRKLSEQLCDDAVAPLESDVPEEMSLGEWVEQQRPRTKRRWPLSRRPRKAAGTPAADRNHAAASRAARSRPAK